MIFFSICELDVVKWCSSFNKNLWYSAFNNVKCQAFNKNIPINKVFNSYASPFTLHLIINILKNSNSCYVFSHAQNAAGCIVNNYLEIIFSD